MLVGRENEFELLENLLRTVITSDANPLSIYIGGTPGTGKTATVRSIIDKMRFMRYKFHFVSVDCFEISTTTDLYRIILTQLGEKTLPSAASLFPLLRKTFANTSKSIIILLDEIDRIAKSRTDALICKAFSWVEFNPGKVVVIGISNSVDLVDRILPKLRALRFPPKVITFSPYNKQQLFKILQDKLAKEGVDAPAIELCARKVSALTGDVRRAFHIANGVLNAMKEESNNENVKPDEKGDQFEKAPLKKKSACKHVLSEFNKVYSSPLLRAQLPLHPRILLGTFMRLVSQSQETAAGTKKRITNRTVVPRDRLLNAYLKICKALSMVPLECDELGNAFAVLESQGMIARKAKGRIAFEVEIEVARHVINDNAILSAIERVDLQW